MNRISHWKLRLAISSNHDYLVFVAPTIPNGEDLSVVMIPFGLFMYIRCCPEREKESGHEANLLVLFQRWKAITNSTRMRVRSNRVEPTDQSVEWWAL